MQLLRGAHNGLYGVPDGLRLPLGLLDEGLELPQLPDLALDLADTHSSVSFRILGGVLGGGGLLSY